MVRPPPGGMVAGLSEGAELEYSRADLRATLLAAGGFVFDSSGAFVAFYFCGDFGVDGRGGCAGGVVDE